MWKSLQAKWGRPSDGSFSLAPLNAAPFNLNTITDVVLQLYTSGTTGHPKGAQLTHDGLMVSLPAARERYPCSTVPVPYAIRSGSISLSAGRWYRRGPCQTATGDDRRFR